MTKEILGENVPLNFLGKDIKNLKILRCLEGKLLMVLPPVLEVFLHPIKAFLRKGQVVVESPDGAHE